MDREDALHRLARERDSTGLGEGEDHLQPSSLLPAVVAWSTLGFAAAARPRRWAVRSSSTRMRTRPSRSSRRRLGNSWVLLRPLDGGAGGARQGGGLGQGDLGAAVELEPRLGLGFGDGVEAGEVRGEPADQLLGDALDDVTRF